MHPDLFSVLGRYMYRPTVHAHSLFKVLLAVYFLNLFVCYCYVSEVIHTVRFPLQDNLCTFDLKHLKSTQHYFDTGKVKILTKETKDYSRKILEVIHICQKNSTLNRDKGLDWDPVWDRVLL